MDPPIISKPLKWVGSSLDDLREMHPEVVSEFGYALYEAQCGRRSLDAKAMKGLGGGVVEIVENYHGDSFRAVYTVQFEEAIYVLHVFQKKSKSGIATPQKDIDLIKRRFKIAQERHALWKEQNEK